MPKKSPLIRAFPISRGGGSGRDSGPVNMTRCLDIPTIYLTYLYNNTTRVTWTGYLGTFSAGKTTSRIILSNPLGFPRNHRHLRRKQTHLLVIGYEIGTTIDFW